MFQFLKNNKSPDLDELDANVIKSLYNEIKASLKSEPHHPKENLHYLLH